MFDFDLNLDVDAINDVANDSAVIDETPSIDAAQIYVDQGWLVPFPVAVGQKHPPAAGFTGRIPDVEPSKVQEAWAEAHPDSNIGLRLQGFGDEWEVISIDVDNYGSKQGLKALKQLEAQVGGFPFDQAPFSTRRALSTGSGQYFFRVPAGRSWRGKLSDSIDVIQRTHRYAVVWPSIVDGEQYRWYLNGVEIAVPSVSDLPVLPPEWQDLIASSRTQKDYKKNTEEGSQVAAEGYRGAINWLRTNAFNFGDVESLSPAMQAVTGGDFADRLSGNAHDTMLGAVHQAIRLGMEGHHGLKGALLLIRKLFVAEVTGNRDGASVRSESAAVAEFERAVVGEVEKIIEDINDGEFFVAQDVDEIVLTNAKNAFADLSVDTRPVGVDVKQYPDTDRGHAQMFVDYWGQDVLVTRDKGLFEFAVWVVGKGRFVFKEASEMFQMLFMATSDRLRHEAEQIEAYAENLRTQATKAQLDAEESDPEDLDKAAGSLRARAGRIEDTARARRILQQLHSIPEVVVELSSFDAVKGVIGTQNAETLDLNESDGGVEARRSTRLDRLTMSTKVKYVPTATHSAWDNFLKQFVPDKELRRFLQKVMGYSLLDENPEKILVFLWGPSNTGKTTILEAIGSALGDYAGPMNANRLFGKNDGGPSPEMVNNFFKRFVFLSEVGDDHYLSANTVKQVTGNDSQQTRRLYSNETLSGTPKFTPYVSTNTVPVIKGADQALARRMIIIPFTHPQKTKRIRFEDDIKKNPKILSAILTWLVDGAKMYMKEGLNREEFPDIVKKTTVDFVISTNQTSSFISDCLRKSKEGKVSEDELWAAWVAWCARESVSDRERGDRRGFRSRMKSQGLKPRRTKVKGKNTYVFDGIRLQK